MILDWRRQCEAIDASRRLDRDDPSDNKSYYRQEVAYVRYLLSVLGLPYAEAKERWLSISNGVAARFAGDRDQLDVQFRKVAAKARSRRYAFLDPSEPLRAVGIRRCDVDYVNSIDCEKWVKRFLLGLLAYYGFARQRTPDVEYSSTLVNWLVRLADPGPAVRSYRDARSALSVAFRSRKRPVSFHASKGRGRSTTFSMPFSARQDGDTAPAVVLSTLDGVVMAMALAEDRTAVCESCGVRYPVGPKAKRRTCDACYAKYRRSYKNAKDRAYYAAKRDAERGIPDRNPAVV